MDDGIVEGDRVQINGRFTAGKEWTGLVRRDLGNKLRFDDGNKIFLELVQSHLGDAGTDTIENLVAGRLSLTINHGDTLPRDLTFTGARLNSNRIENRAGIDGNQTRELSVRDVRLLTGDEQLIGQWPVIVPFTMTAVFFVKRPSFGSVIVILGKSQPSMHGLGLHT